MGKIGKDAVDYAKRALVLHEQYRGKIEVVSKVRMENREDLSTAYTPGVAEPCRKIHEKKEEVYRYTAKGNLIAVVTDGTAVLGLGDIGPEAALPVMEGKAILFKEFAGVDAFPICLNTKDTNEIVETVKRIAPSFGGINLEDISSPRCVEIEERLRRELNIPVFHDDQHGTAIVVSAALINALRLAGKGIDEVRIVINGAGAAGSAIVKMLRTLGAKHMLICDRSGILYPGMDTKDNPVKRFLAEYTNEEGRRGALAEAVSGSDVFIGVSSANVLTKDMVASMNPQPIIFAMANPNPEILPQEAKEAGAFIVGTGRSDFPNQINNVLAFPGIFRGALDVRASDITDAMKKAAAYAIAQIIGEEELRPEYIIPDALDERVAKAVAEAVAKAWKE